MIAPASAVAAYKQKQEQEASKGMGEGTSTTPQATNTERTHSRGASMLWPSHQPVASIPFFDAEMYKGVNLNVTSSKQSSGLDLPLDDITTLRFFFNLGVQQSRDILVSQLQQQCNGSPQLPLQLNPLQAAAAVSDSPPTSFADFCLPSLSSGGRW